jgi:hypothetical protein
MKLKDEELRKLNNYLFTASKAIKSIEGANYRVKVTLQAFIDDEGNLKLLREVG